MYASIRLSRSARRASSPRCLMAIKMCRVFHANAAAALLIPTDGARSLEMMSLFAISEAASDSGMA